MNPTPITDRNAATHGDIVKYWTEDGNHNYYYAYPNETQLKALLNSTTFVPGYCYTDKGNKIYGAYISDKPYIGSSAKFPTGKKLWKYQDVTGLVLANKGLFLPIAGNREDGAQAWFIATLDREVSSMLYTGLTMEQLLQPEQASNLVRVLRSGQLHKDRQHLVFAPVYVGENISGKPEMQQTLLRSIISLQQQQGCIKLLG